MAGLSPKLPLQRDQVDGFYSLNKTHVELVKQNFKMLLLTSPGERIMDPNFGVGLRTFLFEQDAQILQDQIVSKINEQVKIYLPFIDVQEVNFHALSQGGLDFDPNTLSVVIKYEIIPLKKSYSLEISPLEDISRAQINL
tara:strand:+ start:2457 stop:2876 length:420 start_codon:yes stop_codon:yes gene_type:complete